MRALVLAVVVPLAVGAHGARAQPASVARALLASLDESARAAAALPFDSVRTLWNYVPIVRRGLTLARMTEAQRSHADALLRTALSARGFATAKSIVAHEGILKALEEAQGIDATRRDPGLYYTAIFGAPSADTPWGWRFEGHHLSVNVTSVPGAPAVVAPLFMGANPARVPSGPRQGLRLLAAEEDVARALVRMLTPERRRRALLADTTFGEIVTRNDPKARRLPEEGLAASEMSASEREQLRRLVAVYAGRFTSAEARAQLDRIERAGFGRLRFAWAGSTEPGKPHYYRIHGPTLLIEYDDTQSGANHIHSVWRDLERDFGGDLLRAHYERHAHRPAR